MSSLPFYPTATLRPTDPVTSLLGTIQAFTTLSESLFLINLIPVAILGGAFDQPILVNFSVPKNGLLYYTLNGNDPDASGTLFSSAIPISTSSVLRARLFLPNCLPSPITTHT